MTKAEIIEMIAMRFGTPPYMDSIRRLSPEKKREVKIYLSALVGQHLTSDGEVNSDGVMIDGLIDDVGF